MTPSTSRPSEFSRRSFLARSAAYTALAVTGPNLLLRGQGTASKRLNIACIGAAGKGNADRQAVSRLHNIVALVDVDGARLEEGTRNWYKETGATGKAPRGFTDFRKMFDEMSKDIDAVIVSTPDHTHYVAAMWALKHKKHICVQKPLCNTIDETRKLHKAARTAGVVTQMGNQGRTADGQRRVKEWIEQGAIGKLKEVYLWTNRPVWPQGPMTKISANRPGNLNWDLWLGPEAEEPYFEIATHDAQQAAKASRGKSVHPFNWRGWWQFGAGALGDMGCHIMDCAFNVLGQRVPEKIEVESSPVTDLTAPVWSTLTYHLPRNQQHPAFKVVWQDGTKDGQPNRPVRDERIPESVFKKDSSGMMFVGTEGLIHADTYCFRPGIFPEAKDDEVREAMSAGKIKKTEPRSKYSGNPQLEWASCIVEGGQPSSNFDYSAPLSEFVLLGNLAIRAGETIEWDAEAQKVKNVSAANRFIKRSAYRAGWL